jgi:hypothetical protein
MDALFDAYGGYIVAGIISLVVIIAYCVINNKLLKK